MSEKERAISKSRFSNDDSKSAGCSDNSSLLHLLSVSGKGSEAKWRTPVLNQKGKELVLASETKLIAPYVRNKRNRTVGSSYSNERDVMYSDYCEVKLGSQLSELKWLHRRLELLEEDTKFMKKVFFRKVEERHELLKEISHHLQSIQEHLQSSQAKEKLLRVVSIIDVIMGKNSDAGLPQVLEQDQNTIIITKRKLLALSTTEAGYIAAVSIACHADTAK